MAVFFLPGERMRIWPPGCNPSVSSHMLKKHFCSSSVFVISRHTRSMLPRMTTRKTAFSSWPTAFLHSFNLVFDPGEPAGPQGTVFRRPAVVDHLNRYAIQIQLPAAPFFIRHDKTCPGEHAQMLHDSDAADPEKSTDMFDGAPRTIPHDVEDLSPGGTSQRRKNRIQRVSHNR